ncbi:MAG: hypothetical protein H7Y59_02660 [Anaerolineales bacterium]|nr:hypothetical protein [Anaerolineales bacterium]
MKKGRTNRSFLIDAKYIFLIIIFISTAFAIILYNILIAIPIYATSNPEVEKFLAESAKLEEFESIDINVSSNSIDLYYSLIPDGSGIVFVDVLQGKDPIQNPSKYIFKYFDFKTRETFEINEIVFNEEYNYRGQHPYIYWLDKNKALIGAQTYIGLCNPNILNSAVIFSPSNDNLQQPIECINRTKSNETYDELFNQFYLNYSKDEKTYIIYKVLYKVQYSDASYILINNNGKSYVLGNYIDERVSGKEKLLYTEFDKISLGEMRNVESYTYPPLKEVTKNHSIYKQYYFTEKVLFDCQGLACFGGEWGGHSFIEIYNSFNEKVQTIYLGQSSMMGGAALRPIGYEGYWSDSDQIIILRCSEYREHFCSQLKLFYIDPEK